MLKNVLFMLLILLMPLSAAAAGGDHFTEELMNVGEEIETICSSDVAIHNLGNRDFAFTFKEFGYQKSSATTLHFRNLYDGRVYKIVRGTQIIYFILDHYHPTGASKISYYCQR